MPGSEYTVQTDLVLIAEGFLGSELYVAKTFGVGDEKTNVATKSGEYLTSAERVFTAGDVHRGQSLVVWGYGKDGR